MQLLANLAELFAKKTIKEIWTSKWWLTDPYVLIWLMQDFFGGGGGGGVDQTTSKKFWYVSVLLPQYILKYFYRPLPFSSTLNCI